jgi:hypothetical protein
MPKERKQKFNKLGQPPKQFNEAQREQVIQAWAM